MFKKDSFGGTVTVVVLLSLVCSIIVAGSAVLLRPEQIKQKELDKQKNILEVAGLMQPKINIQSVYSKNIEPRLVDSNTGDFVAMQPNFNSKSEADNPKTSIKLSGSEDIAKITRRANIVEVYLVKNSEGKIDQLILPIYGTGLWSVMYGFVSVQPNGNIINGITYYDEGETPGLGAEIKNPVWQAQFKNKELYNKQGNEALFVAKGGAAKSKEHGIDALSGATLTSNGVSNSFKFWFGKMGFKKFLDKYRAGEAM